MQYKTFTEYIAEAKLLNIRTAKAFKDSKELADWIEKAGKGNLIVKTDGVFVKIKHKSFVNDSWDEDKAMQLIIVEVSKGEILLHSYTEGYSKEAKVYIKELGTKLKAKVEQVNPEKASISGPHAVIIQDVIDMINTLSVATGKEVAPKIEEPKQSTPKKVPEIKPVAEPKIEPKEDFIPDWFKDMQSYENNDYQNRNGDYPRGGVPDLIGYWYEKYDPQNMRWGIHAEFKNTDERTAKRWLENKLSGFISKYKNIIEFDPIYANQTGDYEDDWVQARLDFMLKNKKH